MLTNLVASSLLAGEFSWIVCVTLFFRFNPLKAFIFLTPYVMTFFTLRWALSYRNFPKIPSQRFRAWSILPWKKKLGWLVRGDISDPGSSVELSAVKYRNFTLIELKCLMSKSTLSFRVRGVLRCYGAFTSETVITVSSSKRNAFTCSNFWGELFFRWKKKVRFYSKKPSW